jgi:hypothetical protein
MASSSGSSSSSSVSDAKHGFNVKDRKIITRKKPVNIKYKLLLKSFD